MKTLKLFTLSLAALVAMPAVAFPTAGSMEHVMDYATQTVAQVVEPVKTATASAFATLVSNAQKSAVVQAVKAGFTSVLNKATANPRTTAAIATVAGLTGAYLARKPITNAAYKVANFAKAVAMSPVSLYNWIKAKHTPEVPVTPAERKDAIAYVATQEEATAEIKVAVDEVLKNSNRVAAGAMHKKITNTPGMVPAKQRAMQRDLACQYFGFTK